MKQKNTVRLTNSYKVWKDKRVVASLALVVYGVLQLAAFVPVPVVSLVYAFTVGLLVGNCFGMLIFAYLVVVAAKNLIPNKVFQKIVVKGSGPYLLGVGTILFLVSFTYYFTHTGLG